jgi:hypothetical protein
LIRIRPPARPSLDRTEIGAARRVIRQLLLKAAPMHAHADALENSVRVDADPRVERPRAALSSSSFLRLRVTLLSPDIVEATLDGRQPKGMQLDDLTRPLPSTWDEQRTVVLRAGPGD